ncbi:hypothetical protein [Brevibacillus dissolubilis]|uniref:hypothetical protein n=1 Tax=Brevibacillus dissolubilis TaxID=1844116 RepID=UPI001116BC2B|nr:hypothetical protein [Brevibacillus dissolubilis]
MSANEHNDDRLWFMDVADMDLEDLVELKLRIGQGRLPNSEWHKKPSDEDPEGITMDEWIQKLEQEFRRLGM